MPFLLAIHTLIPIPGAFMAGKDPQDFEHDRLAMDGEYEGPQLRHDAGIDVVCRVGAKMSSGACNAQSTNASRNETGGDEPLTFAKQALYRLAMLNSSSSSHVGVKLPKQFPRMAPGTLAPAAVAPHRRNPSFCYRKLPIFCVVRPRRGHGLMGVRTPGPPWNNESGPGGPRSEEPRRRPGNGRNGRSGARLDAPPGCMPA